MKISEHRIKSLRIKFNVLREKSSNESEFALDLKLHENHFRLLPVHVDPLKPVAHVHV